MSKINNQEIKPKQIIICGARESTLLQAAGKWANIYDMAMGRVRGGSAMISYPSDATTSDRKLVPGLLRLDRSELAGFFGWIRSGV